MTSIAPIKAELINVFSASSPQTDAVEVMGFLPSGYASQAA
jgi:hypothetical protein